MPNKHYNIIPYKFTTKDLHRISQILYTDCCDSNHSLQAVFDHATTDYVVPRTLSKFGERAFPYACRSSAWNRLSDHIRRQSTPATLEDT